VSSCYVCAAPAAAGADPRNPLCDRCRPARDHVVSMTLTGSHRVATCRCGWTFAEPIGSPSIRDDAVKQHWCAVVEAAEA
jgi:hypothetical protein